MENQNTMRILTEMPKRIPKNGTFELTVRCNLHCKMCLFRHDDKENPELMAKELTAEQWIDMARQAAEAGTMSLLITGGEPMLRPDFCEIWEGIYKQGFVMELYTNATLVSEQVIETLRKYPPHKIGITIYGASPDTYEKVCGNAQAFEKMLSGIRMLHTLPSIIELRTTLIRDNRNDLPAIDQLAKDEFGEDSFVTVSSNVYKAVRGACEDVSTCRLSPQENHSLRVHRIIERAEAIVGESFDRSALKFHYSVARNNYSECNSQKISLLGCKAGMNSYTVSWDGKLLACQMLGAFWVDILNTNFLDAWENLPFQIILPSENQECQNCSLATFCQSCYGSRYAETMQLNGCSEYMKQEATVLKNFYRKSDK